MIQLLAMTENDFNAYLKAALPKYAAEKKKGEGLSQEEADKVAEESFHRLLPQGVSTPGQHLFSVRELSSGKDVGILWFAHKKSAMGDYAFIYDIELHPEVRGRGYGKAAMELVEAEARKLGLRAISLHVFGHNATAIKLYEKTGYRTTNINMTKDL